MKQTLIFALALALCGTGVRADDVSECGNIDDPDGQIRACTRIIERGEQETQEDRARAFTFRGYAYYTKRNYDRAIENYDEAVVLNPSYALAYKSRGIAYTWKKDYDRAISDWTKAIDIDPEDADTYRLRGDVYLRADAKQEAIADYRKALKIDPAYQEAKRGLEILGVTVIAPPPDVFNALNREVVELYQAAKYAEAIPIAERYVAAARSGLGEEHTEYAKASAWLAALYKAQARYSEAERLLNRAFAIVDKTLGRESPIWWATLHSLAELHRALGRYGEAEKIIKRYLELAEQEFGSDHPYVATRLDNLAGLYSDQARYGEAELLYQRALRIREARGLEHPEVTASLNNLAVLYQAQGRYAEAEPLLKRALTIEEKALGPKRREVTTSLNNLAVLYQAQGRYVEAEPLLKRALEIVEKGLRPDHPEVGTALNNLAMLYHDQGRYAETESLLKDVRTIYETALGPEHPEVATALNNLALLYSAQGRYEKAESLYQDTLSIREKVLGTEHPAVATTLSNLAVLLSEQGLYDEAEPLYQRALAIEEKVLGPEHPDVATKLNNLALHYYDQGRYDEAQPLHQRALMIREGVLGPEHPYVATSLTNLAWLYQGQRRYREAELLLKRALAIEEKALTPEHPSLATTLNNLAVLYSVQGRYAEAEPLYRRVRAIVEKTRGPDHPYVATSLGSHAALSMAQKDWRQAVDDWQKGTCVIVRRTRRGMRDVGKAMTGKKQSEAVRLSAVFKGLVKATYRLAIEEQRSFDCASSSADKRDPQDIFQAAQWAQGSEAAASLAEMAARGAKGDPELEALASERQKRVTAWQATYPRLLAALARPPDKRDPATEKALREQMSSIDVRLAEIDARLKKDFREYDALVNPEPLTIAELQGLGTTTPALLRDDEALVLFLDTTALQPTPEETFIWVVTRRDAQWFRSDLGTEALEERVTALRCGLDPGNWVRDEDLEWEDKAERCIALLGEEKKGERLPFNTKALGIAHELYQELLAPAEELIAGKELLIVPSGPLTALPFQVLLTEAPDLAFEKMPDAHRKAAWLTRRHALTVLPAVSSLRALRRTIQTAPALEPFLGFGDPILIGGDPCEKAPPTAETCPTAQEAAPIEVAQIQRGGDIPSVPRSLWQGLVKPETLHALGRLCDAAFELCRVANSLDASSEDSLVLGEAATETAVKALNKEDKLSRYRVVHFATHGLLAGQLGETDNETEGGQLHEAGLVFTPPEEPTEDDDGLLTASEITELKLNADWAILSACNTAAGDRPGTEALSGLARAFFYAGTRSLLVSHWPVVTSAAVELTTQTLEHLRTNDKTSKAEALRQSMEALYTSERPPDVIAALQGDKAHPTYWAPFVIVGEGR